MDLGDAAGRWPSPTRPPCLGRRIWGPEQSRPNSLQSSQPVFGRFASMGRPLYSKKRSGRGIHSFLAHLALGVDLITGLKGVNLVRFNPDGMVNLLHSLFSIRFDLYSASQRIFAYWGGLPVKGLPLVVDITNEAFAVRHSICAVPRLDHVMHLGVISPPD